jgi:hypothetical protein
MTDIPSTGSTLRERNAASIHGALLSVLVFQNLFNAFSPYLTLAINITVVIFLLIRHQLRYIASAPIVIFGVYAVLAWMILVTSYRGDAETQVLLKYFRVTVAVSLFALIFGNCRIAASTFVKAINVALGFHVLLVMLQIVFPYLTNMTAPVFGFEREIAILEQYTMRKLGASSSYDTASLLSVAALLFFYLQFTQGKGSSYLLLTTVAFVATLMSSRTGVAMSLLIVTVLSLRAFLRARFLWKLVAALWIAGLMVLAYNLIYPLLLHSLGISELQSDEASLVFAAADYGTTGTLDALTGDHLKPLDQPLLDLFIGFAVDPNTIEMYTDVGYVKLIYHVGIVGTLIVLFVHLHMLVVTRTFMRASAQDLDRALIARFLFVLIAISLAFNYKSLEIHSRGIGDFIYMLFLFLVPWRGTRGSLVNPSHTGARSHS